MVCSFPIIFSSNIIAMFSLSLPLPLSVLDLCWFLFCSMTVSQLTIWFLLIFLLWNDLKMALLFVDNRMHRSKILSPSLRCSIFVFLDCFYFFFFARNLRTVCFCSLHICSYRAFSLNPVIFPLSS